MVGVAPGAKIHSFKVLNQHGGGSSSAIIAAIDRVIQFKKAFPDNRVVINLSLGGYAGTTNYGALDLCVLSAIRDHKITVVVAAGNNSSDAGMYTQAHVYEAITVGAYDADNAFAAFSNYGAVVDLLAPGKGVVTTNINSSVKVISGTPFSCPYTAGAAALYTLLR